MKTLLMLLAVSLSVACSNNNWSDDTNPNFDISLDLPDNQIVGNGGSFTLRVKTTGKWRITVSEPWCTFLKNEGSGSISVIGVVAMNNDGENRSVTITVESDGTPFHITLIQLKKDGSSTDPDPEPEPEPTPEGYAGRIEIPRLKGGDINLFYTHTSTYNGKKFITYSAEYDCGKKHTRWVAFTFDNVSNKKNTNRSDKWGNDPKIPSAYQTYSSDYKSPYNRGHLVASADRYITKEANVQTFYYSNMSPQIVSFNGGIWNKMEEKVRDWSKSLNASDTVYVVKGGKIDGTIADGTLIEYTGNQVAVPRYYFMAILSLKGGTSPQYKGMAFYIDQKNYSSSSINSYAISIKELEEKTDIDFFHNLPADTETAVETNYSPSDWNW